MMIGPYGAGKSTLLKTLGLETKSAVLIDNDEIRDKMSTYQNSIRLGIKSGLTYEEADADTWKKWRDASIYTGKWVMNRLHEDGFDIIRMGAINNKITHEICENAKSADCELNTVMVYAPLPVCQESIAKRVSAGGHPTNADSFIGEFVGLPAFSKIVGHSVHLKLYWRPEVNKAPVLIGEGTAGKQFSVHDSEAANKMATSMDVDNQKAFDGETPHLDILAKSISALEQRNPVQKKSR